LGSYQLADYYYEERTCILRCVLHLLTYFQDERHPYRVSLFSPLGSLYPVSFKPSQSCFIYIHLNITFYSRYELFCFDFFFKVEYADCIDKLEKELVSKYRQQFEELYKTEAPTWETHGNLMVCGACVTCYLV
jgi:nuclear pore complex protein Nup188